MTPAAGANGPARALDLLAYVLAGQSDAELRTELQAVLAAGDPDDDDEAGLAGLVLRALPD